jgi:signal transduction histidine kinase
MSQGIRAPRTAWREVTRPAEESADRQGESAAVDAELVRQIEEMRVVVAALREANAQLERAIDGERERRCKAEAAARVREEVLAVVAHDLRCPLALVGATTEFLLELDAHAPARVRLLDGVMRAVGRMNRLVGDLLDVVRSDAGRLPLDPAPTTARTLLGQAEEAFRAPGGECRVRVEVDSLPHDVAVLADPGRLLQVLGNLIGNALKFSEPSGHVVVRARPAADRVVFEVEDTGPGIPPDQLDRLFDRFWQGRPTDRRGIGLGLAIARGIVDAHGGRIWAENRVAGGSTFAFAIPAHSNASPPTASRSTADCCRTRTRG